MLIVVASLSEERGGAVGRALARACAVRGTEAHVIPCRTSIEGAGEIAAVQVGVARLCLIDFLTYEERPVVVVFHGEVVVSRVGPYVVQTLGIAQRCQWLVLVDGLRTFAGVTALEAALVCPL